MLAEAQGELQVILMASGSEVQIAVQAREALQGEGIGTRVVSVPCLDWFEVQDEEYIESVLPPAVTARVSIEAAVAQPWWRWLGAHGRPVSLEHYGASADFKTLTGSSASPPRPRLRPPRSRWPRPTGGGGPAASRTPASLDHAGEDDPVRAAGRTQLSRDRPQLNSSTPTASPSTARTHHGPVPSERRKSITMTTPQSTNNPLAELSEAGVSLWLDDLSRQRLQSGQPRRPDRGPSTSSGSPPTRRSSRPR